MNQHTFTTPPPPTVWPSVGFTNPDAGIAFLEGLGFVVTAQYRDEDGTIQHAEARWPDGGGVMFGSRGKPGDWRALGPSGCYVACADKVRVESALAGVRGLEGVEVLAEPELTSYGSFQFNVRDADANLWSVGTYLGE
ncbi:hypothetical protein ACQCX5_04700 [Propionibacteriaceae bacterium G57]|uniref:hypothetical protein n=1 Tax=Aestuariimicrobium sp. G57 TaxID=3418485 RepID=UPI003DA6E1B9